METTVYAVWGCNMFQVVHESCQFGVDVGRGNWNYISAFVETNNKIVEKPEYAAEIGEMATPISGRYKVNTDAAIDALGMLVGLGIVICDSDGFVMAASSADRGCLYPQVVEAIAIYRGILLARETGIVPIEIESDAAVVVGWISDSRQYKTEVGVVIDAIGLLGYWASSSGFDSL
ncbi:hypothetical protein Ddye_011929 [Dipteronia dyeriana]|uniref:RNase H type-1 domain-containing protein n=1 Tax=Dipteronia dyeriana TaxID=168575 RepID=A0AAD9X3L2_9ROSI|nr:hypothetical protein Ddye_011929 [Dipteronia dyeriana]